jgi:hypothetical protein
MPTIGEKDDKTLFQFNVGIGGDIGVIVSINTPI